MAGIGVEQADRIAKVVKEEGIKIPCKSCGRKMFYGRKKIHFKAKGISFVRYSGYEQCQQCVIGELVPKTKEILDLHSEILMRKKQKTVVDWRSLKESKELIDSRDDYEQAMEEHNDLLNLLAWADILREDGYDVWRGELRLNPELSGVGYMYSFRRFSDARKWAKITGGEVR